MRAAEDNEATANRAPAWARKERGSTDVCTGGEAAGTVNREARLEVALGSYLA